MKSKPWFFMMVGCMAGMMVSMVPAREVRSEDLPHWPDGYAVAVHLDCGVQNHAQGKSGISLHVTKGQSTQFAGIEGPMSTAAVDEKGVVVEVNGLVGETGYVMALGWWDADNQGRLQSVFFSKPGAYPERILPPAPAKSFYQDQSSSAVILFPFSLTANMTEPARFEIRSESGPGAVLNEVWLLRKQDQVKRKSILIVTGDEYPGHLWRETAPAMAAALREDPDLEVSITESPMILGSPLLRHYDAVMIHFKDYPEHFTPGEEARKGLREYVDQGGGVMVSHFGCGAFQEWPGFVEVAGRVWNPAMRGHDPHGSFEVRAVDTQHPITAGLTVFSTTDEMYTCLDGTPPIHVLYEATSVVDRKVYPVAFTLEADHPRLVHCTLGHDKNSLANPGAKTLYRNAARWVTGLSGIKE